jgi:hypothetical protein
MLTKDNLSRDSRRKASSDGMFALFSMHDVLRVVYGTIRHAKTCVSQFTERTPGSFIEGRDASIVWRYFSGAEAVDSEEIVLGRAVKLRRQKTTSLIGSLPYFSPYMYD